MRATDVLLSKGCQPEVYLCSTHPVFAGPVFDRLARPEIREVIDVTDHAAGSNPFYEASAK